MIFVDANVFIHSFLSPKRKLTYQEKEINFRAKKIIEHIDNGVKMMTSTVHLSYLRL